VLQDCPAFSTLDETSISKIVDTMEFVVTKVGAVICRQGDAASTFYLIVSGGECSVTIDGNQVASLRALDVFGESALFPEGGTAGVAAVRSATVTVEKDDVELLTLSKKKFDTLVNSGILNQDCRDKLKAVAERRSAANCS
jgi:CRP-like cAMP-binding protein